MDATKWRFRMAEREPHRSHCKKAKEWYYGASFHMNEEDDLRKRIIVAIGGLALLAGCGNQGDKPSNVPAAPKWQGAAYHIAFDTQATKPNPAGITIPVIKYTANPEALERRASLVVRFDTSGATKKGPMMDQMIMGPVDIPSAEGTLPADYMDAADKGLSKLVGAYCIKGKIKLSVALARSSLSNQAGEDEVNTKRLSDWLPIEIVSKNAHPHC